MQRRQGRNNAEGLFGVERIPSDGQIRNLLDPVDPARLREPFGAVYERLGAEGYLKQPAAWRALESLDHLHHGGPAVAPALMLRRHHEPIYKAAGANRDTGEQNTPELPCGSRVRSGRLLGSMLRRRLD